VVCHLFNRRFDRTCVTKLLDSLRLCINARYSFSIIFILLLWRVFIWLRRFWFHDLWNTTASKKCLLDKFIHKLSFLVLNKIARHLVQHLRYVVIKLILITVFNGKMLMFYFRTIVDWNMSLCWTVQLFIQLVQRLAKLIYDVPLVALNMFSILKLQMMLMKDIVRCLI